MIVNISPSPIITNHLSIISQKPAIHPSSIYHQPSIEKKPYAPWCWYIYLHNWVILCRQMLGFIFQHHGLRMGKSHFLFRTIITTQYGSSIINHHPSFGWHWPFRTQTRWSRPFAGPLPPHSRAARRCAETRKREGYGVGSDLSVGWDFGKICYKWRS